jgi:CHAT domain-containing protein
MVQREYQKLQHNFSTLRAAPQLADVNRISAQRILQNLYAGLAAPWMEAARAYKHLVIVPHGLLHYLPFQAFYDGERYLLQRFAISYLPGSSFLDYPRPPARLPLRTLIMGHSQNGRLPHVRQESEAVAALFNARPCLDEEATRARFQADAPAAAVLHIASHGDFQPANPLFSGLHLEDGLLTTLDVFNLRLRASLATLSACQSGRSRLGGGDELFGLTRAFLAAGVESLILSLWAVADETTTHLMLDLYDRLLSGQSKGEALRQAQVNLLSAGGSAGHPYFWAPYFLVGDAGPLLAPKTHPLIFTGHTGISN